MPKPTYHLRYAPSLGVLARDIPLNRRLEIFAEHGLAAVEYSCAGRPGCGLVRMSLEAVEDLRRRLDELKLEMGTFVANTGASTGAGLCDADERKNFLVELQRAVEYHRVIGNGFCTVLTGAERPALSREEQRRNIVEGLKEAAEILAKTELIAVLEPVNRNDSPSYFLSSSDEAAEIVSAVGSRSVRILFDIYHQAVSGEDVIKKIRRHHSLIGYYQTGDVPGRKEPGTGKIKWDRVLGTIHETGYGGFIGIEHETSQPGEAGLVKCLEAYGRLDAGLE